MKKGERMHKHNENRSNPTLCSLACLILAITVIVLLSGCAEDKWKKFEGGNHLVFEIESSGNRDDDYRNMSKTIAALKERLNALGLKNSIVSIHRERQLVVQLPKVDDLNEMTGKISRAYSLEFKLVRNDSPVIKEMPEKVSPDQKKSVADKFAKKIPADCQILFQDIKDNRTRGVLYSVPFIVEGKTVLEEHHIAGAKAQIDSNIKEPFLLVRFDPHGARIFEEITSRNIGRKLAIVFDGSVHSAPVIRDGITGGEAMISGGVSMAEAKELETGLNYPYPAKLKLVESKGLTREIWLGDEKK
jgi:preprotein translocase subunit SecD